MSCRSTYKNILHFLWTPTIRYCVHMCSPPGSIIMQLNSVHALTQLLKCFFFPVALRPDSGSWPILTEIRDHTHWTQGTRKDSPAQVISPSQRTLTTHTTHKRQNTHSSGGIRTYNRSKRESADPRLRPRGHQDWHFLNVHTNITWPSTTMASSHIFGSSFPLSTLCALHIPHPCRIH